MKKLASLDIDMTKFKDLEAEVSEMNTSIQRPYEEVVSDAIYNEIKKISGLQDEDLNCQKVYRYKNQEA